MLRPGPVKGGPDDRRGPYDSSGANLDAVQRQPFSEEESGTTERFGALLEAYKRRETRVPADRYSRLKPETLLRLQEVERRILELFREKGVTDLSDKRILEVGCGTGAWLRFPIQAGASPEQIYGVDLLGNLIREARRKCPQGTNLRCEDACESSFPDDSFDIALAMTVFSSILDPSLRKLLARSILRVVRRGGSILWYDFHVDNPRNPDVRGVRKGEIRDLLTGCSCELRLVTLAPPIGRVVARTPALHLLLSNVPLLCTHYLGWITRT